MCFCAFFIFNDNDNNDDATELAVVAAVVP